MSNKVEVTNEMLMQLRAIPPCSIGVQSNTGLVDIGIKTFYIARIVLLAIASKKITLGQIWEFYKALTTKFKTNHGFIYWGSGKNETVDALPEGVRCSNMIDKIKGGSKIKVYANTNITVENMQIAKAYSYSSVGKLYGYIDFASFVTDLIDKVFGTQIGLKPSPYFDTCIENAVTTMDYAFTGKINTASDKICPNMDRAHIHPQELTNYLESKESHDAGWYKVFDNTEE